MEGVGARLGRSSTRYGPATVFTGPVRKWKKKWVYVTASTSNNNHHHQHQQTGTGNGTTNGSNGSHLLLFKWTPITPSQNKENGNNNNNSNSNAEKNGDANKNDGVSVGETPKRKFKYIPVAVLEEQKNEASEEVEEEAKLIDTDTNTVEPTSKSDRVDEKPDINDMPIEESQDTVNNPVEQQDLNASTLDLSLGLKSHDGDNDPGSKKDRTKDAQSERLNSRRT